MNAKETYDRLENILTKPGETGRDAGQFGVFIRTSEPHVSGGGIVPVTYVGEGGDWYKRKILLTPAKELVPKESHRDVAKKPIPWGTFYPFASKGTANTPCCPNCENSLNKSWTYCPKCGQKLDWEK